MEHGNIILATILIVLVAAMILLKIYQKYKNSGEKLTFDEFLDEYLDNIIKVLQDAISILMINIDDFDSKENYEKAIIETAVDSLKENATDFGVDANVVNVIDTDTLTNIVYDVFQNNTEEVFAKTDSETIVTHNELYEETITKTAAEEILEVPENATSDKVLETAAVIVANNEAEDYAIEKVVEEPEVDNNEIVSEEVIETAKEAITEEEKTVEVTETVIPTEEVTVEDTIAVEENSTTVQDV